MLPTGHSGEHTCILIGREGLQHIDVKLTWTREPYLKIQPKVLEEINVDLPAKIVQESGGNEQ